MILQKNPPLEAHPNTQHRPADPRILPITQHNPKGNEASYLLHCHAWLEGWLIQTVNKVGLSIDGPQ